MTLPAGVLLLVLGAVTLWRSRRMDGSRAWRYLRRALIGAAGLVVVMNVIAPFMAAYGYTHLGRAVVPEADLGGADYEELQLAPPGLLISDHQGKEVVRA